MWPLKCFIFFSSPSVFAVLLFFLITWPDPWADQNTVPLLLTSLSHMKTLFHNLFLSHCRISNGKINSTVDPIKTEATWHVIKRKWVCQYIIKKKCFNFLQNLSTKRLGKKKLCQLGWVTYITEEENNLSSKLMCKKQKKRTSIRSKTAAHVGCSQSAVVYQRKSGEPATGSWVAKAQ